MPLGAIALPQSITQEREEASLRNRFGVEELPDVDKRHSLLRLTTSEGSSGPDRKRIGLKVFFVLVLLAGAAAGAFFAWKQGLLG